MINTIYVIAGPTATGKSEFSINLAKKIRGVVINSDSMQVYRNLEKLTARPSKKEMKNIDHYLYGYVEAKERFNVERWCNDASQVINKNCINNLTPILVGGTGLYINTLINGVIDMPQIKNEIKIESEKILKQFGKDFLISQIQNVDPESLKQINPNESTGKKFSEWKLNKNKQFLKNYNIKIILFLPDREKNYHIVNSRFVQMLNNGAIEEVKKLLELQLHNSLPIMRAHGVPEIIKYLNNKISFDECINKGQQVTRNYVKRQHTWWNSSNLQIFQKFDKFPSEIDLNTIKID